MSNALHCKMWFLGHFLQPSPHKAGIIWTSNWPLPLPLTDLRMYFIS